MKALDSYQVKVVLGVYPSERATWYVVTLPGHIGTEIYKKHQSAHGGFRSLKVAVRLGGSVWQTSIFRDSTAKSYILIIKASIRKREQILAGDAINLQVAIL